VIINYLEHIQPIWDKTRTVDVNGTALPSDMKCTNCHAPADVAAVPQVPAGQLDLTSAPSDRDNKRVMSFSELFTTGPQQEQLTPGGPVTPVPDTIINNPDGTVTTITHTIASVMSAGSAHNSGAFFACFDNNPATICGAGNDPTAIHTNLLTKAELRLLSEWLDIGGQYYNDVVKAAAAQ
jgi:hypothetical protein